MTYLRKFALISVVASVALFSAKLVEAGEGRYQAHWNGKSYLILDTDQGHIWSYHGDTMLYSGRVDGDEFEPPMQKQIWNQNQGKWTRQK